MTSDALPEPMTPPNCDLRGMGWMPLHGNRLSDSNFEALATDEEYRAAHKLWWAAWQSQVPAASLPDNDRILAHLAGFARDLKGWLRIKEMALYGFSKCSDGRLYHAFLATEALVAFDNRLRADKKRESDRERLAKWRETKKCKHDARLPDDTENRSETRFNTRNDTQDETLEVAEKSRLRPDQTRPDQTRPYILTTFGCRWRATECLGGGFW